MSTLDDSAACRLQQNLAEVRGRIAAAAARSGRGAEAVILVGVTKYVDASVARLLVEAGHKTLGESRPQTLWDKAAALADLSPSWHLIGHLQRNKVRRTVPLWTVIHSADSLRLLQEVSREADALKIPADVLLEVNVSGDRTKHGFHPDEIEPLLPRIAALPSLFVLGLMTMASREGDLDRARREFAELRTLRDRLAVNCPKQILLNELSMGMSGDYEVAIEEGATIVRIGSALFEGVTSGS
ncbi:MAG: YggS family pyridoxal phosphate-dependent enzyme [Pirellulaceae bacterium]